MIKRVSIINKYHSIWTMSINFIDGATIRECHSQALRVMLPGSPRMPGLFQWIYTHKKNSSSKLGSSFHSYIFAMPFADTSCLAHVALSRYKKKTKKCSVKSKLFRSIYFIFCFASLVVRALPLWELLMKWKFRILGISPSSCCLPAAYGRKLRATVCCWWQLCYSLLSNHLGTLWDNLTRLPSL